MMPREFWKEMLQEALPGEQAQLLMAPTFRGSFPDQGKAVRAAVLVLLYPVDHEIHLVFMKRNEYDGPHSGQVSFPGGAWEADDISLKQTAIRETREELGVKEDIEILGALTPLHIPVSNFMVSPFVGWIVKTPVFHPDRSEVQYVIEVPLRELLDPAMRDSETLHHHGRPVEAPFYRVGLDKIWGATAMMLSEFLQLAARMQSRRCS
jgi:8-oxo-dGTP pyrophosphatase MutT (NUDIX family)